MASLVACAPTELVVGTFNLRVANRADDESGNGWDARRDSVFALLRTAHLWGLQEVGDGQLADLRAAFPDRGVLAVDRGLAQPLGESEVIFYDPLRLVLVDDVAAVQVGRDRLALEATFAPPGDPPFRFITTHVDGTRNEFYRLRDVVTLVDDVVLVGDFNALPGSNPWVDPLLPLLSDLLDDAYARAHPRELATTSGGWPVERPQLPVDMRIDWILTRGFETVDAEILHARRPDGGPISDHAPVVATLRRP